MSLRRAALIVLPLLIAPALAASSATTAETPVAPGTGVEITVYPGDLALVRDQRTFRLTGPETRLAFTGVSNNLMPNTAAITVATSPQVKASEIKLLDQTFAFNVISQQTLLEQSVGQEVTVVTTNPATGRDTTQRAKVLAVQNGVVLDIGGKIHTEVPGRLVFDAVPPNLRAAPTLLVTAAGPAGKDINAELGYLTTGLGWHADYVARYDAEGNRLDLTAWATVSNTTGLEYKDAKLKLAAGDVRTVSVPQPPRPYMDKMMRASAASQEFAPAGNAPSQSLEGISLYSIARPTTLANGESKQIMLAQVTNAVVKRDLLVRGQPWFYLQPMPGQKQTGGAEIEITLKNDGVKVDPKKKDAAPSGGLGVALPPGTIRAYGEDNDGRLQFLGEDQTPGAIPGGEIKLKLGRDADIAVTREQTTFVRASDAITISAWRISIKNAKAKPAVVRVEEPVSGAWEVTKSNIPHTKNAAGLPEWTLTIPAKAEAVLEYNVKAGTNQISGPG